MLNSLELERELQNLGFERNPGPEVRIHEFRKGEMIFYVKTPGPTQTSGTVQTRPLVVIEKYRGTLEQLSPLRGIDPDFQNFYHNTGMRRFGRGITPGGNINHRGVAVGIESAAALQDFISILHALQSEEDLQAVLAARAGENPLPSDRTERRSVISARIGQGKFRDDLFDYWGACAVTGVRDSRLLRASHIKPWRDSDNKQRLDPYNGLLLSGHLDLAFDSGLISFSDSGNLLLSKKFKDASAIGISSSMSLARIESQHHEYLYWHRKNIFKG